MATVLFVDDDTESLELYASYLRDNGHEVTAVSDGVHALAALDASHFDILVTDMVMPFIDGDRLARLVRHRFAGDHPFVVALSAATLEETRQEPNPFIDVYVAKGPFSETAPLLLRTIEDGKRREGIITSDRVRSRKVTEELLERRRELELILNRISQGVLLLDADGRLLYANDPALQLLGMREEDVLARSLIELSPFGDTELSKENFKRLASGRGSYRTTLELQGGEVTARAELTSSPDAPGNRFLLFLTDVSAEHAFSSALKRSERGYRAIVESTSDLLWTLDTRGELTYVNPASAHFTDFSAGDYYAQGPKLLFGTDSDEELAVILATSFEICRRGESHTIERKLPTKGGEGLWALVRISPLRDDAGDFIGLRCIATNVHRRRLAEEQLRRAVTERESLIQEIHHRVKNSVQLLISMLRLRLSEFSDPEVQKASVEMENRFRVIASVYSHLYEYRKLDRLEGSQLIRSVVNLARGELLPFDVEIAGPPFVLSLDHAIPLGLIVREIVSNVGRHVAPRTTEPFVRIDWNIRDGEMTLRFSDNGPGFSSGVLEQPRQLGFLIANSLVEQLRGEIRMEESSRGATLLVTLRYAPPEPLEETETL